MKNVFLIASITTILFTIAILYTSCCPKCTDKDNAETILTSHTWKITSWGVDNDNDNIIDGNVNLLVLFPCRQDDIITFIKTPSYNVTIADNSNKCSASDPAMATGSWGIIGCQNPLVLSIDNNSHPIISINNSEIRYVLYVTINNSAGQPEIKKTIITLSA